MNNIPIEIELEALKSVNNVIQVRDDGSIMIIRGMILERN